MHKIMYLEFNVQTLAKEFTYFSFIYQHSLNNVNKTSFLLFLHQNMYILYHKWRLKYKREDIEMKEISSIAQIEFSDTS